MDNNGARFLSVLSVSPCLARDRATERCVCVVWCAVKVWFVKPRANRCWHLPAARASWEGVGEIGWYQLCTRGRDYDFGMPFK